MTFKKNPNDRRSEKASARELDLLEAKLTELHRALQQHTFVVCKSCEMDFSCCHDDQCRVTAKCSEDDLSLLPVAITGPRFLDPAGTGCVVPPEHRVLCTYHYCDGTARRIGLPMDWHAHYWALRDWSKRVKGRRDWVAGVRPFRNFPTYPRIPYKFLKPGLLLPDGF